MLLKCHRKLIQLSSALIALALSGCFSIDSKADPTRFYTLAPLSFSDALSGRLKVVVSQVPYYLSGRKLVIRSGEYEVEYLEFHRWAEPLDVMLERRLQSELMQAGVSGTLEVVFTRFEVTTEGHAVLAAEWSLKEGRNLVGSGTHTDERPWRQNQPASEMVATLDQLLQTLVSRIADEAE